jgi:REP element-mobilizing transposase RayT
MARKSKKKSRKKMKYHPHGSVLFCTFSLEEGLLLLANPLCEALIKSCLGRAMELHPVRICHILVEATHVHIVLVVVNPEDVAGFMRCFKTESAHMINRLLGRKKRTLWCEGYDSPIVLTPKRALIAIAYLYSNPAKDNLESSIDRYPGFSSWEIFQSGRYTREWERLRRFHFSKIPKGANNLRGYTNIAAEILQQSEEIQTFTLEPNAWLEAFGYRTQEEHQRINDRLVARVRLLESRAEKKRVREKKKVLGRERLIAEVFDTTYRPQRKGRQMWCLSEKRSVRVRFIESFKVLMDKAREVRDMWRQGRVTVPYPPGLYPPSMPRLANELRL